MSIVTELIAKTKEAKSERASLSVLLNAVSDAGVGEREILIHDILDHSGDVMAALRNVPSVPKEAAKPAPAVAASKAEPAKSGFGTPPQTFKPKS